MTNQALAIAVITVCAALLMMGGELVLSQFSLCSLELTASILQRTLK